METRSIGISLLKEDGSVEKTIILNDRALTTIPCSNPNAELSPNGIKDAISNLLLSKVKDAISKETIESLIFG